MGEGRAWGQCPYSVSPEGQQRALGWGELAPASPGPGDTAGAEEEGSRP